MDELPGVLWENRTTPSSATGETLFFLVYGAEAVLPSELEYGSPRVEQYGKSLDNDNPLKENMNHLEEYMRRAVLRVVRYQQNQRRYFQRKVRTPPPKVGDMVLRRVQTRTRKKKSPLSGRDPSWLLASRDQDP